MLSKVFKIFQTPTDLLSFVQKRNMNMIGSGSAAEPDFSLALAKITRMSKEELNDLLNHEEKADDYIKSLDQVSKRFFE